MKITHVEVRNYRNIDGLSILLDSKTNYIIGENNLGKSNFLELLETICSGRSFDESDFLSPDHYIEVTLELVLNTNEQGFFGDNFSPEDETKLKIKYTQKIDEAFPTIIAMDTGESIPAKQLKKIHFIKYDTNAVPSKVLRLDTKRGAGLFVNSIVERYIVSEGGEQSFLNEEKVDGLRSFINEHLEKIRSFNDYSIKATVSDEPIELLSRLFYLSDGKHTIDATGSGVQFMAMASINVLCKIVEIYKSKALNFQDQIYIGDDGKKYLPLILSIDEPEVHLHPFLQRALINYYKRILNNEDDAFKELLDMCFGIDGLDGQLIIVTHSTDALIGDYRNLIRFYKKNGELEVVSGPKLTLTGTNEKQLLMHFPEIKESFYAHCAILIEGETEYGCIRTFAEKLGISLDDYAISVINARGQSSIKPLQKLFEAFGIPSVAIYDNDVKQGQTPSENEFFTNELCFEIEVVKHLYANGRCDLIKEIVSEKDEGADDVLLDADFVRKPFNKMNVDVSTYTPKKLSDVMETESEEFCNMYSAWYMTKKGIILGRIIGEILPKELIPECYVRAISKAQEVAINV